MTRKKGLRKRNRPDIKGIVEKKAPEKECEKVDSGNEFDFNPKKIRITPESAQHMKEDDPSKEKFLSENFLEKWKDSLDD